jgi:hypothetical protein
MKIVYLKRSIHPSNSATQSWENEGGRVDESAEEEWTEDSAASRKPNRLIGTLKFKTRRPPEQHMTLRLHRLASHNQAEED